MFAREFVFVAGGRGGNKRLMLLKKNSIKYSNKTEQKNNTKGKKTTQLNTTTRQ